MHNNPLLAIKKKQIADALAAGDPHPYQQGVVPVFPKPEPLPASGHNLDRHNPLHAIKLQQIADAGGDNPYESPVHVALKLRQPVLPSSLAHYQAAMDADLATLSGLNTLEDKAAAKLRMLGTYWPFVAEYLDSGDVYPNDVAVRVMIWLFDVLDIERGLLVALALISQGVQVTPAKFDRDIPTFVCDAVYDWANNLLKADPAQSASPYLDNFVATLDVDKWDLSPPVKSKMFVMLAKHKKLAGDWLNCLSACEQAVECNPEGAGVKTLMAEAQSAIQRLNLV